MTYKIQIDDEVRDATQEEVLRIEAFRAQEQAREDARQAAVAAKASAQTKLAALGLTEDEVKAIIGGV